MSYHCEARLRSQFSDCSIRQDFFRSNCSSAIFLRFEELADADTQSGGVGRAVGYDRCYTTCLGQHY